ncbi:MAG: hypothetical protein IKF60_08225 [Solobacterium sp.]|nr:hypothetical protein [Solobacterium sp.]
MKRSLMISLSVFLLCACGGNAPKPAAEMEPSPEPSAAVENRTGDPAALEQYQAEMDPGADLEIGLLGVISETNSLDDILNRAADIPVLSLGAQVNSERIIYGDRGKDTDNVYLLIPARNTDVKVGRYNWYAGEITETWFSETSALPFIYIEDGDAVDPVGKIEYVRHFADGDTEGFMYTGLQAVPARLRTEFHMGIVDITPYTEFNSGEVGSFAQYYFDTLCSYEEIQNEVRQGKELSLMGEMIYDGRAYTVYSMEVSGENRLYAITRNTETGTAEVLYSYDSGDNWKQLGHG